MKSVAGAVLGALLLMGRPVDRTADVVSTGPLLDTYLRGDFDRAVTAASSIRDMEDFSRAIERQAPDWIAASTPDAPHRRLAAAALVLEVTHARIETDWATLRPLLEWACQILKKGGPPTEGEHRWHLAVIALAGRARDFGRLSQEMPDWATNAMARQDGNTLRAHVQTAGHLAHTFARFPDEPRVLMATTMIAAAPFDNEPARTPPRQSSGTGDIVRRGRITSLAFLQALQDDSRLAAEAAVRAGHIHYAVGSLTSALDLERLAQRTAQDPDTAYLAHFTAGRILQAMHLAGDAASEFQQALALRPRAQSAALALAAIRATEAQTRAFDLLRPALDSHSPFDDPWRLYGYGDYVRWPDAIAVLRVLVRP
jgi:DNA-binding FadR family transcriptional regulator